MAITCYTYDCVHCKRGFGPPCCGITQGLYLEDGKCRCYEKQEDKKEDEE